LHANGTAMPEIEITRLLEEIGAAQDLAELAAIVSLAGEIDDSYDEESVARVIDAIRQARQRLDAVP
jgi:hypothetical protein